jgi:hypothetical protein
MGSSPDWAAWSREAVALMQARNAAWTDRFSEAGAPYTWDLDRATMTFPDDAGNVVADLCIVGTASLCEGTFLWAWANETMPKPAFNRLDSVRMFGDRHQLDLLATPEWDGGRAEGLEMLAVAGRILDADGTFVDTAGDLTMFFLLFGFRREPNVQPRRD